jgi:hypothetical protein
MERGKPERMQSDRELLGRVLDIDSDAVYDASAASMGRERDLFRFILGMRFLCHTDRSELTEALRFSESSHGYLLSRASRLRILETRSAL